MKQTWGDGCLLPSPQVESELFRTAVQTQFHTHKKQLKVPGSFYLSFFFFFFLLFDGATRHVAAASLQSCPTLCDPIDGSPPGSPIPGILQARTLEWVAISFSSIVGSYFPDQGSHPHPLHWRHILNHWTTREVPLFVRKGRSLGQAKRTAVGEGKLKSEEMLKSVLGFLC